MVTLRRFTATEWRDLERGCRALIQLDEEAIARNKTTTVEQQFIAAKEHHLEMLALCELYARRADERSAAPQSASPPASRGKPRSA